MTTTDTTPRSYARDLTRTSAPRDLTGPDLGLAIVYARHDGDAIRESALLVEHARRAAAIWAAYSDPIITRDEDGRRWISERSER